MYGFLLQVKLDRAEWGTDLPNVEMQLETHRTIHAAVEELDSSLKEAKIYEVTFFPIILSHYFGGIKCF